MLPVLVHYCDSCNYNTPVEYSSTAWIQEQTCNHCGVRSLGADTGGQSKCAMNSAQHDELAQLFAQNMHVSHTPAVEPQPTFQPTPQTSEKQTAAQPPIHFISTHYTPTAHIRAETRSEPSRSPPPPYNEALMPEAMVQSLLQNSIDPSTLLPNQIELFLHADYEQRLRLLELWRISPPSYPTQQRFAAAPTSVEREEAEARARYEEAMKMQARAFNRHQAEMEDTHVPLHMRESEAEPYILDGYDGRSASQHAIDPVYAAGGLWQANSWVAREQHPMENQYGMYEQIRNHAEWERMNGQRFEGGDDDMVM